VVGPAQPLVLQKEYTEVVPNVRPEIDRLAMPSSCLVSPFNWTMDPSRCLAAGCNGLLAALIGREAKT